MKEEGTEGDYIEDIDGEVAVDRWVSNPRFKKHDLGWHVFMTTVAMDVSIGIDSDIDILYRHPTLAVSGCRYRMLISKTDTDIWMSVSGTVGIGYRLGP